MENKTEIILPSANVFFEDGLYAVENIKDDVIFSFSVIRTECSLAQEIQLVFEYLDFETQSKLRKPASKLFFRQGECQKFIPLRISSYNEDLKNIVIQSKLLEENMNAQIQDSKFLKVILDNMVNEETIIMIKSMIPVTATKRMLHAEFYGFDDRQPTIITAEEVSFFRNVAGRGCQIAGTMFLKQVPGNFHISTHHKGAALQWIDKELTARHTVHFLEFTRENDPVTEGSLGSKIKTNFIHAQTINAPHAHDVEYYLKIVGSKLNHPIWGESKFYEYVAHVNIVPKEKNVILIEFKYEFDPISMKYTNLRRSLANFIVSLLAIIGGIFATSTLIDKIIGG